MAWIETHTGDGVLNDARIERIFCETPNNLNQMFNFYAVVNGRNWLIYAGRIPNDITAKAENKEITDEISGRLVELEFELFKKVMSFINDAKNENDNQVISLGEKFSES